MNDAKEEIRARLAVEDVVGQYIELRREGRNLKGRSPWGVDRTPSFMVSPEKGIWHDFSANRGGDIFAFVMEVEGISFREALEKLAQQAGVDLSKYKGGDSQVAKKKARAKEALELATKYYQWCLAKNKQVCEYVFYKRNLNRATVKEFRIGYAPKTGKALTEFLSKKGFSKKELGEAGLLNRFDGDLFRGRMMVPFIDTTGNVIGFTARVLDNSEPKYLNTPETLLFNKGRFIFGLSQAKESIRKNGFVVIVEGNMDVISSHQAGVKEVVATSGTAMTEMHLKALSNLTDDIRLAYDGDEAGVAATERAIKIAGDLRIKLAVISDYGGAKDPDELIQRGADLWVKAVEKYVPAVEWVLKKYEESLDLTTADGKQEYSDKSLEIIKYLPKVQQKHYKQMVAKKLNVAVEDLEKAEKKEKKQWLKEVKTTEQQEENMNWMDDLILAIEQVGGVGKKKKVTLSKEKQAELELIFEQKYQGWTEESLLAEIEALQEQKQKAQIKQKIDELIKKLEELGEGEEEKTNEILRQVKILRASEKK